MVGKFMRDEDRRSVSRPGKNVFAGRVNPLMTDAVWEYLAQSISAMKKPIFSHSITGPPLRDFLSGTLNCTLKAASNSRLSFFVGHLSKSGIISSRWQTKLGNEGRVISSSGETPISVSVYKSMWSNYKDFDYDEYEIIKTIINAIAGMIGNNAKIS